MASIHDEAAAAAGLTLMDVKVEPHGATRHYGEPGREAVRFAYTLQPPCQLLVLGPYRPSENEAPE